MDEIRRQLAELMESVGGGGKQKQFTDDDVCKYYITGLCPHTLFENTKQYMGECRNIHSDELKDAYLEARKSTYYGYENLAISYLKPHLEECDRRIAKQSAGGRCASPDTASESIEASARRSVDEVESEIAAKLKEAETLGNDGKMLESMRAMDRITELQAKKQGLLEEKETRLEEARKMFFQRLRPCEVCGALLSEKDGENRLNEHFLGRIHLGYEAIRKQVETLQAYIDDEATKQLPRYHGRGTAVSPTTNAPPMQEQSGMHRSFSPSSAKRNNYSSPRHPMSRDYYDGNDRGREFGSHSRRDYHHAFDNHRERDRDRGRDRDYRSSDHPTASGSYSRRSYGSAADGYAQGFRQQGHNHRSYRDYRGGDNRRPMKGERIDPYSHNRNYISNTGEALSVGSASSRRSRSNAGEPPFDKSEQSSTYASSARRGSSRSRSPREAERAAAARGSFPRDSLHHADDPHFNDGPGHQNSRSPIGSGDALSSSAEKRRSPANCENLKLRSTRESEEEEEGEVTDGQKT